MKTPISYYGGKQSMLRDILPLIPKHKNYIEAFFGGGSVLFAKDKSSFEVINDKDSVVANFFHHLKNKYLFEALKLEIHKSFMTRHSFDKARLIINNPHLFSSVEQAWSFWYLANFSFNNSLDGGYRHKTDRKEVCKLVNKIANFDELLHERMKAVEIEQIDALDLIAHRDKSETFFYIDPPYLGANQGHYRGYKDKDFVKLLEILGDIKGKFLLSCFDTKYLSEFIKKNHWQKKEIIKPNTASNNKKLKTELLIFNYQEQKTMDEEIFRGVRK